MRWTVRRAVPADSPEVSRINVRSWQQAYPGVVPASVLLGLRPESREPGWARWLGRPEPSAVFVALDEAGRLGAYCAVSSAREERDRLPGVRVGELVALYVDPDVWGTGAGHALSQTATDFLAEQGFEHAVLWVLRANLSGRRFYERHGWSDDGVALESEIGGERIPEVRYSRSLSPA
ncbi:MULTISPECIES: GNAT family N-acetyltransferase [Actinoalloteichus]|uniref:Sortase-like acyltransferase n=1 Tax=Actinoalloteichus fjordicus TaxID=1612552 RepID=A0AAC9LAW7_9PSEU|nr:MULTISPECIES: GNAT family N-acetyltransferase [Actinoalloteichus]APU14206.1 sortase-like acyltransferase [Actinoalloteichus fjordicus]APU20175.1 sortase-like acyltransferase [Actinoalloteichus sp. GBA129-24]